MRVLHVAPDISRAFGGPTQALLGFLAASNSAGIDAEVVAPAPPGDDLRWFRQQAGRSAVHVFPTWGRGSARISRALLGYLRAQRGSFDVVHVHGMFNAISTFAAHSCRHGGVPYVIGPFGTLSRYTFEHRRTLLKRAYFSLLDSRAIRGAGALHFTTAQERDEARRLSVVRGVPAAVVPPPWMPDDSVPATVIRRELDHERLRRPGVVLFLSRIHPVKGLETLLEAWLAVRAARPAARLVIAGSGDAEYERTIRALAAGNGSGDSVRFTGFVTGPEKARLLSEADVFVLPSHHENFGVAVIEAMAAGLPAVVSREVQLSPVVKEQGLGVVVERTAATLAAGILAALDDIGLRQRCASEGPTIARSLFTPDSVGRGLGAMYRQAGARSAAVVAAA